MTETQGWILIAVVFFAAWLIVTELRRLVFLIESAPKSERLQQAEWLVMGQQKRERRRMKARAEEPLTEEAATPDGA